MSHLTKLKTKSVATLQRIDSFEKLFALLCALALGATSIVWAFLGARLQQNNADQLVNSYMFTNWNTFSEAIFPSAHTFLIKWPLFWLLSLTGPTNISLTVCTVMLSLATVASLGYLLYRIERRPAVLGLLLLALGSVLLLVPPEPSAGVLLPVNMAMVATRNLEYVLYIASLTLLIKAPKSLTSRKLWLAVGVLSLLMASDNLFVTLSVGGAAVALVVYGVVRRDAFVRRSALWLGAGVSAFVLSMVFLWLISILKLTHIVNASPYGLVQEAKDIVLGLLFGALGVLANLGANPVFDVGIVKAIPGQLLGRLLEPYTIAFAVNVTIAAASIYAMARLLGASMRKRQKVRAGNARIRIDTPLLLSLMLIFSLVADIAAFAGTNHEYAVDARYFGIVLFAAFISLATWTRVVREPSIKVQAFLAGVLLCSLIVGTAFAFETYRADQMALNDVEHRNEIIAHALASHPVGTIMGDYWRVLPIKSLVPAINALPLASCTQPRDILTSGSWQKDATARSFAYLLSLDEKSPDFPDCTLNQIVAEYGKPNASFLVAGKLEQPGELLLFYDNGTRKSAPVLSASGQSSGTVVPITPDKLPRTSCPNDAPTIMNIVAHEDDDLLFLSPDLLHDIKQSHCVRTVYVTAGDAGGNKLYWLSRERGSEAAYDTMLGLARSTVWVERIVKLSSQAFASVANPRGNPYVSLVFMHLPDGNLNGQGFKAYHNESLERLESGKIPAIHSVDGQSVYTSDELVGTLSQLMSTYMPREVRTQAPRNVGRRFTDHSDHTAVGRYTEEAFARYHNVNVLSAADIKYYIGYPTREMPQNVFGDDLRLKVQAFNAYGAFDGSVCHTPQQCNASPTYGSYLGRQLTLLP